MTVSDLPSSVKIKVELMFEGIRYSEALGRSVSHSFPNYYPYRFKKGETGPTGKGTAAIPYLLTTENGTLIRIKGNPDSNWTVSGSAETGYWLGQDGQDTRMPIEFEPRPNWLDAETSDGFPMVRTGVSLHGDMAVINVAPGCDYFTVKSSEGESMRCTFCSYGAPDARTQHLGQVRGVTELPERTYTRMQETLRSALDETEIRHIYLVGGSMTCWEEEGRRYLALAEATQRTVQNRIPVSCGSGALLLESMKELHTQNLVDNVCFNLEVWSQPLFERICPGKQRFVGYSNWIKALENAVALWGRERVYTAMVAGIELEPEHQLEWKEAADLAIQGAENLCSRGIIPIYSLYWPLGGRDHPEYFHRLRSYFARLNLAYQEIRQKYGLQIWDGFMCHRCAYMQLECDLDRQL